MTCKSRVPSPSRYFCQPSSAASSLTYSHDTITILGACGQAGQEQSVEKKHNKHKKELSHFHARRDSVVKEFGK